MVHGYINTSFLNCDIFPHCTVNKLMAQVTRTRISTYGNLGETMNTVHPNSNRHGLVTN